LCFVVAANTLRCSLQSVFLHSRQAVKCGLEFSLRQHQGLHVLGSEAIETLGVRQHGRVAALLHIGQNFGHARFDGCIGVGRPMQALLKHRFKIGIGGA